MIEGIIVDLEIGEKVNVWVRRGSKKEKIVLPLHPKIYVFERDFYKFERLFSSLIREVDFVRKRFGLGNMESFAEIEVGYKDYRRLKSIYGRLSFQIFHLDIYEEHLILRAPSLNPVELKLNDFISGSYIWGENAGFPEEMHVYKLVRENGCYLAKSVVDGSEERYCSLTEFFRETNPDFIFTDLNLHGEGFVLAELGHLSSVGLEGYMEKAYFSYASPRRVVGLTIGNSVSSRQDYMALIEDRVLPQKENENVFIAKMSDYSYVDASPLTLTPEPGLYEHVAALDFTSMFPHIILKYNISYENTTLDGVAGVEGRGFLPRIIEEPLHRRLKFKKFKSVGAKKRVEMLKLLLVACYGYAGKYDNRFGNAYINHWINRFGSILLSKVVSLAKESGLKVLYADTDSVFVQYMDREALDKFRDAVSARIGIPFEIDHDFKRVVFVRGLSGGEPVIKRYYGLTVGGEVVVKGLMSVKRNVPKIVREFQLDVIRGILSGLNRGALLSILERYKKRVLEGLEQDEISFEVTLSKDWTEYREHSSIGRIARISKASRGGKIRLFYRGGKPHLISNYRGRYDSKKYISLLERAYEEATNFNQCETR